MCDSGQLIFNRYQFLAIASAAIALAVACRSTPSAPAAPPVSADTWAVVDGRDIKRADVDKAYQRHGIGKEMIAITRREIGDQVALILLAAPEAMDYYPKVGFEKITNGYVIKRKG